ncbi:MAG: DnaB-like helicase C-terminal domain-containing protein, partial [Chloroflexota bacterium]|nr:DnaB-like helicase C-terminal domain-containing protein [Chloroflexota bacterium]
LGTLTNPNPYTFFGTFAGLDFWPGGLTLLAAAPGIGKTSWMLQINFDAALESIPSAIGCYEHTAEELKYRLEMQAQAAVVGPHLDALPEDTADHLAQGSAMCVLPLSDQEDTVRAIEDILIHDYGFPPYGPALLSVDYLQRVPVVGITGVIPEELRAGEAAAALRKLARKRNWAIIVAAALRSDSFEGGESLGDLLGDERVPYEADRVLLMRRNEPVHACGCVGVTISTLKDRTGPIRSWDVEFWGERFYSAGEADLENWHL